MTDETTDTRHDARRRILPLAGDLRIRVYEALLATPEQRATCDALELASGLSHQTTSARLRELVRLGFVRDSGLRRPTRTGRTARVYETTEAIA